jgi:hypothetical protein
VAEANGATNNISSLRIMVNQLKSGWESTQRPTM